MMRSVRFLLVALFVLAVWTAAAPLGAQGLIEKNFHYFQPPADGSGIVLTYGSESLNWLGMHYGVYGDEAIDHLTVILTNGKEKSLIQNQLGANVLYSIGISRFLNAGFAFPFVADRTFDETYLPPDVRKTLHKTSLEDMRADLKGILFDRRRHCLGLAADVTVAIPLDTRENSFLSDGGVEFTPRLIFDMGRRWWNAALNVGYRFGKQSRSPDLNMEVQNEILMNLGGKFRFAPHHELMVDSAFRTSEKKFFSNKSNDYGEVMGAYRYLFGSYSHLALTVGAGAGLLKGAGTPTSRFFLGITVYEHRLELRP